MTNPCVRRGESVAVLAVWLGTGVVVFMVKVKWAVPRDRRRRSKAPKYHLYRAHLDANKDFYYRQQCKVESEKSIYHEDHLWYWSGPPVSRRCQNCQKLAREFQEAL